MNNNEVEMNNNENKAQEMTEAIYNAHATVNEALLGQLLTTEEKTEKGEEEKEKKENGVEAEKMEKDENEDVNMEGTVAETTEGVESQGKVTEEVTDTTQGHTHSQAHTQDHTQAHSVSPQLVKEQLKYCQRILKGLKRHREAGPFLLPVDPVALGIPDYFDVIKQPMDLGTISKRVDLNEYASAEAFMADVRLMLTNCFTYNAPDSQVTKMGRNLEKYFNTAMAKMPTELGSATGMGMSSSASTSTVESPASRPKRESVVGGTAAGVGIVGGAATAAVRRSSSPSGSMTFCSAVLRELMKKTNSHLNWPFMIPVDPIALGIPDYFDVIKQPMDLGTIRKKIDTGMYGRPEQFESDVRLVFTNCYTYNPPESDVYKMAQQLEAIFDQKMSQKPSPKPAPAHAISAASSTSSLGHGTTLGAPTTSNVSAHSSSSFIPSSASQLIPGLDALEDDSEKILAINHQIQILQAELNYLLLNRKSGSISSASMGSVGKAAASSSAKPKKRATPAPSTLNKPAATGASAASSTGANEEMSFEEKRQLSEDVSNLPQDNMMRVLEIIQECMPNLHSNGDSDVIELDIEALDLKTLRALQGYIWECHNPGKKRPATTGVSKVAKKSKDQQQPQQQQQQQIDSNPTQSHAQAQVAYDSSSSSSSEDDD